MGLVKSRRQVARARAHIGFLDDDVENVAVDEKVLSQRLARANLQLREPLPDFGQRHVSIIACPLVSKQNALEELERRATAKDGVTVVLPKANDHCQLARVESIVTDPDSE